MAIKNTWNRILSIGLIGVIFLGMLAAAYLAWERHRLEAANRQVELMVDYAEVRQMARRTGLTLAEVLKELKGAGVTGVLFKEQALNDFSLQIWAKSGNELIGDSNLAPQVKKQLNPDYTYLLTNDLKLYGRLIEQFQIKLEKMQALENPGGPYLVGSPLGVENFQNIGWVDTIGLGFPLEDMALAESLGLNLQVQIKSWPQADDADFQAFFKPFAQFERLNLILFIDKTLPGAGGKYLLLAEEIRKLDVPIGLIEFYDQKGFKEVATALDKQVVRLHSIDQSLMPTMDPKVARERYTLAVTDRNIRAILVRFYFKTESADLLQDNLNYVGSIARSIQAQGFTLGAPEVIQGPAYNGFLTLLIGLAVIAGGVLLLHLIGLRHWSYLLGILAALVWLFLLLKGQVNLSRKLMALGSVVIYPSLAVLLNLEEKPAGLLRGIGLLLRTSLISLIGALLLVGLLADVNFMLKLDQFSGVKLAHILPLLIVAFVLFWRMEKKNWAKRIVEFLQLKITVGWAILAAVFAVGFFIYITRTGNSGAASGLELQLRSFLEQVLLVRPRTKEFLIGHPLLLLTFYLGYKHWLMPLLFLGAIGQISMVNTFAHVHTPVAVSLFRAFNGLWLGIVIGIILIIAYRLIADWGRRLFHG